MYESVRLPSVADGLDCSGEIGTRRRGKIGHSSKLGGNARLGSDRTQCWKHHTSIYRVWYHLYISRASNKRSRTIHVFHKIVLLSTRRWGPRGRSISAGRAGWRYFIPSREDLAPNGESAVLVSLPHPFYYNSK